MEVGDRVFLTDKRGRWDGTITRLSHHQGLVIVKWDTGNTERVAVEELTAIEGSEGVRPDGPETEKGGLTGQQPY